MKTNCAEFFVSLTFFLFFRTEGRSFWVGLNKRDPEHPGAWEWSDNTPVSAEIAAYLIVVFSSNNLRASCCLVCAFMQVVTTFIEDKAEDDDRRHCAVYSYLTNAFIPQLCDAKHEWICKIAKG